MVAGGQSDRPAHLLLAIALHARGRWYRGRESVGRSQPEFFIMQNAAEALKRIV
jgi:hypothetical protein